MQLKRLVYNITLYLFSLFFLFGCLVYPYGEESSYFSNREISLGMPLKDIYLTTDELNYMAEKGYAIRCLGLNNSSNRSYYFIPFNNGSGFALYFWNDIYYEMRERAVFFESKLYMPSVYFANLYNDSSKNCSYFVFHELSNKTSYGGSLSESGFLSFVFMREGCKVVKRPVINLTNVCDGKAVIGYLNNSLDRLYISYGNISKK